jgi:BMFP domain-containing protein YqiC
MQTDNRLFDDFARLAGGALNALSGLKTEVETLVHQQFERLIESFQLVTREEFEAVQAMAAKARADQEELAGRVAALESSLASLEAASHAPAAPRPRKAKPESAEDDPQG